IAVRALREARQVGDRFAHDEVVAYRTRAEDPPEVTRLDEPQAPPAEEVVRVVEGRVIVQPTQDQMVAATMTRPSVRLSIFAAGLAHALRPESRDRITALMRREYRARKRARQRAARAAARATNDPPPS